MGQIDDCLIYGGPIPKVEDANCGSLGEFILNRLKKIGDKVVLIDGSTSEQITASQLRHRSIRFARALQYAGIKTNDSVFICSEDRMEFAYTLFGTLYLGANVASVESYFLPNQIGHMIDETKPKIVFCSSTSIKTINQLAMDRPFIQKIILLGDHSEYNDIATCQQFINDPDIDHADDFICDTVNMNENIALILRTSGTTGFPKGILVTQKNLLLSCIQFIKHEDVTDPIAYSVVSWVRGIGVKTLLKYVLNNSTLVFLYPQRDRLWRTLELYEVNTVIIHPELMKVLAKMNIEGQYDFSNLKVFICGGAILTKEIEDLVRAQLPHISIRRTYGMVELSYITEETTDSHKHGSVGKLLAGVSSKVIDPDTGVSLGRNKPGELCYKGDIIMKKYLHVEQPEKTVDQDGWFHSGDIGYYDDDGDLFLVGRVDDLIKYDGKKISPFMIERILMEHPTIRECGVIGISDDEHGEIPAAVIVKHRFETISLDEIKELVLKRTNIHLGKVLFVRKLPRSIIGKLMRSYLRIYCSDNPAGNKEVTIPFYLRWYENHKM